MHKLETGQHLIADHHDPARFIKNNF